MTSNIMVSPPYQPFTLPNKFSAVFNGEVWCGLVDKDPLVPANQVQVYVVNEDGSRTPVPQPIKLNSGGFLVYNGNPAKFVTDSNHSLAVRNSTGAIVWYHPNMANVDPQDSFSILSDRIDKIEGEGGASLIKLSHQIAYEPASVGFRLVNCVYVTDYPFLADPSSTSDQTAAFQAAADHAMSFPKPKTLVIPHGNFVVNGTVSFGKGKTPRVIGLGESSVIRRSIGSTYPIFLFNDNFYLSDMFFSGSIDGGKSNAVKANGGNTAKLERIYFQNQDTGVELVSSFAVEVTSCVFDVCYLYGVISTTACHNIIFRNNNFFTVGVRDDGHAISIQVATDNVVIDGNDFEYCNVNVRLSGCTAVQISGNYMEYHKAACFDFVGTQYSVDIERNWIALGLQSGTGYSQLFKNITGGSFVGNTVYNQRITFESSCSSFDVGSNTVTGTGDIIGDLYIYPALLNGWQQQANYSLVGYKKSRSGWVSIRGAVVAGSGQSVIFNIPAGYRPKDGAKIFACSSSNGLCSISVKTNGDVYAISSTTNNPALDGIMYYVG